MTSYRIKEIANLIEHNSVPLDVGTDHAKLLIYLVQTNKIEKCFGSDISKHAINNAQININKLKLNKQIKLIVSDGINELDFYYDTLIISGLGYHTMKSIINNNNLPETVILQPNSKQYELRKFMNTLNYKIDKEIAVLDNNKYYNIIKYKKGHEKLKNKFLLFGKSSNKDYYNHLILKYEKLMPKVNFKRKLIYKYYIYILRKL